MASMDASGKLTYHFADAQGSILALANNLGQVTEKYTYSAYGLGTTMGPGTAAYRYTGRRFDPETGLYYYRARMYSASLGRFLQPDPIGVSGGLNIYAYTGNDPVNHTDSTGLWFGIDDAVFIVGGGLIGGGTQGVVDLASKGSTSWGSIAAGAVSGAVGSEIALYTVPTMGLTGGVIAGIAGGAAGSVTSQLLESQGVSGTRLAIDAAFGGAAGLIPGGGVLSGAGEALSISGVTAGRGSMTAIFNQITTKAMGGTIDNIAVQTAGAMGASQAIGATEGGLFSSSIGAGYNAILGQSTQESSRK